MSFRIDQNDVDAAARRRESGCEIVQQSGPILGDDLDQSGRFGCFAIESDRRFYFGALASAAAFAVRGVAAERLPCRARPVGPSLSVDPFRQDSVPAFASDP